MLDLSPEKTAPAFDNPGFYALHTSMQDAAEDILSIRKYLLWRDHLERPDAPEASKNAEVVSHLHGSPGPFRLRPDADAPRLRLSRLYVKAENFVYK
jgi:hypothetical protein